MLNSAVIDRCRLVGSIGLMPLTFLIPPALWIKVRSPGSSLCYNALWPQGLKCAAPLPSFIPARLQPLRPLRANRL